MQIIGRNELKEKLDRHDDFRLIEVLAPKDFHDAHLPGAENVPLSESFEERVRDAVPDKNAEVVLYCANTECPASEKAARRMEALGYEHVLDYEEGKAGWKDAGLPMAS